MVSGKKKKVDFMPWLAFLFFYFCRSGNLLDMAKAGSVHEYLIKLHEKYGEIASFLWGKEYAVSLSSVDYWKEIQPIFDKPCKTNLNILDCFPRMLIFICSKIFCCF